MTTTASPPSQMRRSRPFRIAALVPVLGFLLLGGSSNASAATNPEPPAVHDSTSAPAAPPATPVWPAPALRDGMKALLTHYFKDQRASAGMDYFRFAPQYEADKASSAKDPDTLWAYGGMTGTNCYSAVTRSQFIDCAGNRMAATFGLPYSGGLTFFDANKGYYTLDLYARIALYYALYHAFLYDYDSTILSPTGYTPATARNAQTYHRAMVRAYEAHARDIIVRMFSDTRNIVTFPNSHNFQRDLTRTAGLLEQTYVPVVQFLEKKGAWDAARPWDRKNAFAVINGMNSRVWYEWLWSQSNGPATAGFVNLGSQKTYVQALAGGQATPGSDIFSYAFEPGNVYTPIPALRSADADDPSKGGTDGFWFDADYSTPGEWWCQATYPAASTDLVKCMAQASRVGKSGSLTPPGPYTPFGQYYGDPGQGSPCDGRAYAPSPNNCGDTNLGSIAEEWMWSFVGARAGMYFMTRLAASDRPAGALGPNLRTIPGETGPRTEYQAVTDRLGYGVSGWHGGAGHDDDLEWLWSTDGTVRAVRTLSAGRHDDEPQNGRYSVGEHDTLPGFTATKGDTWSLDKQEYPGGIENHTPGPSPLYGTLLFNLVVSDKTADITASPSGLAGSLYDARHRNRFDEFENWIWLLQGTTGRCPGVGDPSDPLCFATNSVVRKIVYKDPTTNPPGNPASARFAYLWRDDDAVLPASHVADRNPDGCRNRGGVPWRHLADPTANPAGNSPYLLDDGGYGTYNNLIPILGGLMRLTAERYPLQPVGEDYTTQRAQVLKPWYDKAYVQTEALLTYFGGGPNGVGYVPDLENAACISDDPGTPATDQMVVGWQQGVGDSVQATTIRRAMLYSLSTLWYWWYDSGWLASGG